MAQFALSPDDIKAVTERAEEQVDAATCLFEFTRTLNALASAEQKRALLGMMWRVATGLCLLALANTAAADKDEKKIDGPVIGIDLGTTSSSIAVVRDGIAAALPRGEGLTAIGRGVGGEVEGKGRKGKKKAQGDASIKSFFAAKDAAGGGDQAGGAAAGSDAATEAAAEAPCGLLSVHEGLGVPLSLIHI